MKTASIMEVQHNFSKVIKGLKADGKIAITRHKRVVAELGLPAHASTPTFPDFFARAKDTWEGDWRGSSSDDLLDDTRGER